MTTVDRAAGAPPVRDHSAKRRWVGQSIRRVEDPKFLLGRGGYIADRITPGTLHAAVLRSPHAHARIVRFETAQAEAAPGVHAVITGAEAAELCGPMPDFGPDPARHTWRCLAADKVRYVGEGVAVVVADSRYLAEDALELIEVEYEPLPAVTDPERALAEGLRWCTRRWSRTAPTSAPSTSATSSVTSPRPMSWSGTGSAGIVRAGSRWRPSARSRSTTPAPAASPSTPTP